MDKRRRLKNRIWINPPEGGCVFCDDEPGLAVSSENGKSYVPICGDCFHWIGKMWETDPGPGGQYPGELENMRKRHEYLGI